ncbi:glycoside hydrolase family 43 protein [Deinococcus maricopensis]|uniref:Glycoside hydrolase family 43 n=1 Tax=Deinococcus maricopensis (strain DSM 21211 / LMG 22137 / NRRL B-23946 / LB-34) TaxID=709986 RepID=E8U4X4_DEIML|nr:glycoside hydrolase family 43 protein [Deinococcus maricopensis]ADV66113.1 glycoside hydrolase family 43 [Deinococcus maricopensis DSM 21211]
MNHTYTNPVYPDYFADPFVLRVGDDYYAYGTSGRPQAEGRAFEVLHSTDLITWRSLGGALDPLDDPHARDYWAPEVAEHGGRFYMYYSAGTGDKGHQLRVAVADAPQGPFRDARVILTPDDPFTIDASPFRDDDGQWYLYYARDFLDGHRVGTALAVSALSDMTTLHGERRTVLRATADWQIYRHNREMYGQIYDWYTLEGPFVVKHGGKYYCFYSGGAWEEPNYGVSYAVADHPMGPWTEPDSDGPTLLRSIPGQVVGPGHNSVVLGPDGHHYLVYHAWDPAKTARRMCLDRIEWTPDGPRTNGPTLTPQPAPVRTDGV